MGDHAREKPPDAPAPAAGERLAVLNWVSDTAGRTMRTLQRWLESDSELVRGFGMVLCAMFFIVAPLVVASFWVPPVPLALLALSVAGISGTWLLSTFVRGRREVKADADRQRDDSTGRQGQRQVAGGVVERQGGSGGDHAPGDRQDQLG
ncbi:hypothetical protein JOD54_005176 [Actinokineospora baliensis]|uniref:hypothetical protein n=1 Tax=Actinokineospora baliensis TaxID=547056 RepID=UPI00195ADDB4|nr:hypothetical protein [Actinokineospora baliensis]MBM7774972.1 hypothetical protein [Actinokineospora baliensis]